MSFSTSISRRRTVRAGLLATLAAFSLVLGLATSAIVLVDPFDKLGRNQIGIYAARERETKLSWIRRREHQGLLLGSSKTTYIDPLRLDAPGMFNASFPLALPEELLAFVDQHVHDEDFVLIGLDLYMMNEREFPVRPVELSDGSGLVETARYLISGQVLLYALRDYWRHLQGRTPRLAEAGNVHFESRLARHESMTTVDNGPALTMLSSFHFANFEYSASRVGMLERLRDILEQRRIPYAVFINPLSAPVLDLLERIPAKAAAERFRDDVRRIFPDAADLMRSRWSNPEGYFRFDPYHYLPEVGARFINEEVLPRLPHQVRERLSLATGA